MDPVAERLVAIIDEQIEEIGRRGPAPDAALDALLDLRLRVVEATAFEWIEREVHGKPTRRRRRRGRKVPGGIPISPMR